VAARTVQAARGILLQIDSGQRVVQLDAFDPAAMGSFVLLVRELDKRLDTLTATTLERLREALPTWIVDTVFSDDEIAEFIRTSLRAELRAFRRGALPERCPEVDALGAQAAAKVGELKVLLSGYRISQMTLWEAWFASVEDSVESARERNELLRHGSDYFFRYADLLSDYVTDLYQRELEQAVRSGEQRRFHAIRSLLEGRSLLGTELDVDLEQHHLGLVAWGEDGGAAARELASALGRPLLAIGPLNNSWWGWLSGSHPLGPKEERELKRFQPLPGAGIALGLEAFGEAGFRATNRQALRARWVARKTDRSVVFYADVAVEALASDNQVDARAFVAHELRGIDDDSPASQRIRETILAYFAAEHNAASAAAVLGVHQQTVANRLRAAEERLGRPVGARRVELETALRLRACLSRYP
jgi:hypothetical protein